MAEIVVITGASSGIGYAIAEQYAKEYARNGKVKKLYLLARSAERLKIISDLCNSYGCPNEFIITDVMDKSASTKAIDKITQGNIIDLLIACSGVSENSLRKAGVKDTFDKLIFDTNVGGVLNIVNPVAIHMQNNKCGQIAIIGSIAGFLHMASSKPYCASKAAINNYTHSLRVALEPYNVQVSLILPGFVDTPMIDSNSFSTPLRYSAEKAARIIISGIEAKKGVIAFPFILYFAAKLLNILPYKLADYVSKFIDRRI